MACRVRAARSPFRRAAGVILAVALAFGAAPRPAIAWSGHCFATGPAATPDPSAADDHVGHAPAAAANHAALAGGATAGPAPDGAPCDHCPADACAMTAHCSGTATALSAAAPRPWGADQAGRAAALGWQPSRSRSTHPPTPPPLERS